MKSLLMTVCLLISTSSFAMTCKTEGSGQTITLTITDTQPNKDHFTDESYQARIDIFEVNGKQVNVSFLADGIISMMPAGEETELGNKEVGFFYREGFNGSELNGWIIPETVIYQGTEYSLCK